MDEEGDPQALFLSTDDWDDRYFAAGIGPKRPSLARSRRPFLGVDGKGRQNSYERSTVTQAESTYHAILNRWIDSMAKRYPHLTHPSYLRLNLPQIRVVPAIDHAGVEMARGRSATREPANSPRMPLLSDNTGKRRRHSWQEPSSDIWTVIEESESAEQAKIPRRRDRKKNPLTQIFCCNDLIVRARL